MTRPIEEVQKLDSELNGAIIEACEVITKDISRENLTKWFVLAGRKIALEKHLYGEPDPVAAMTVDLYVYFGLMYGLLDQTYALTCIATGEQTSREWLESNDAS